MALTAVIFDLDGTLIDTNEQHVSAWEKALAQQNFHVSKDRIEVEIGKGGDKLIPSILGHAVNQRDGDKLTQGHKDEFIKISESAGLKAYADVEPLLMAIKQRGLLLAMATSSSKKELTNTLKCAGVNWDKHFDVIATSEDADESKPAPAILAAAVRKLKVSPTQCVMVGDTPYDADSSRDAGVICLGFTCGRMNDEPGLRAGGMRKVYQDPSALLAHLDGALQIASPGKAILNSRLIESLMYEALQVAREGMDRGEVPIGSVIADGSGNIIARACNEMNASQCKTAHAEMVAFSKAAGKVAADARDLILVSTLEPCVMCLGAAMEAAVDTVLFGLPAPLDGGVARVRPPVSPESQVPRILGKVLEDKSRDLLKEFLKRKPENPAQEQYVQQLLKL